MRYGNVRGGLKSAKQSVGASNAIVAGCVRPPL